MQNGQQTINGKPIIFAVSGNGPQDCQFTFQGNKRSALANLAAYVEVFRMMAVREELEMEKRIEPATIAAAVPLIVGGGQ